MSEANNKITEEQVKLAVLELIEKGETLETATELTGELRDRVRELLLKTAAVNESGKYTGLEIDLSPYGLMRKNNVEIERRETGFYIAWDSDIRPPHGWSVIFRNTKNGWETERFLGKGDHGEIFINKTVIGCDSTKDLNLVRIRPLNKPLA